MSKIVSVANQKGGVAKTTTALHLAIGLALDAPRKKVLLIDLDPQRNATSVLLKKASFEPQETIFHIFQKNGFSSETLHETPYPNLMATPSSIQLVELESLLSGSVDGFFRLSEGLQELEKEFDYIIIDCPPSLSLITINALVASFGIIIPLQVSKFSVDGIQGLLDVIATVQKRYNAGLKILGGLFTLYNPRTTISQTMSEEIARSMKVFKTKIPVSVAVEEAHLLKESLYEYSPKNKVALAYRDFTKEVENVLKKR